MIPNYLEQPPESSVRCYILPLLRKPLLPLRQSLIIFRIEERPLPIHSGAFPLSQGNIVATRDGFMYHNAIVPERYCALCPFPTGSKIIRIEEMLAEKYDDVMGFLAV